MAVGTVSSVQQENWQQIATTSPTGVTSVTFSGLTGYKQYLVTVRDITSAAVSFFAFRFNESSSNADYAVGTGVSTIAVYITSSDTAGRSTAFTIKNANLSVPHEFEYFTGVTASVERRGMFLQPSPITSITCLLLDATTNITGGTITLYGIAA